MTMTIEQICCICIGVTIQAATFALGLLVGASLRRKDSAAWFENEANVSHLRRRP